jgi:hypothetical protein
MNTANEPEHPVCRNCFVVEAGTANPSRALDSLQQGNLQGIFRSSGQNAMSAPKLNKQHQALTGKFPTRPSREFFDAEQGISGAQQGIY